MRTLESEEQGRHRKSDGRGMERRQTRSREWQGKRVRRGREGYRPRHRAGCGVKAGERNELHSQRHAPRQPRRSESPSFYYEIFVLSRLQVRRHPVGRSSCPLLAKRRFVIYNVSVAADRTHRRETSVTSAAGSLLELKIAPISREANLFGNFVKRFSRNIQPDLFTMYFRLKYSGVKLKKFL